MAYLKTTGIVIKGVNTGEADQVITLFTADNGRMSIYANRSRRTKSPYASSCQFLCYSEFVLVDGRNMCNVSSASVIDHFNEITTDVCKLTYAAHICELIYDVIQEEQSSPEILRLLLNTLHLLARSKRDPALITEVFELKLLEMSGFSGEPDLCGICGSSLEGSGAYFDKAQGTLLCPACKPAFGSATAILPGTVRVLAHISSADPKNLFSFEVSPEVLAELEMVTATFLRVYLEKDYKKLDILKTLK